MQHKYELTDNLINQKALDIIWKANYAELVFSDGRPCKQGIKPIDQIGLSGNRPKKNR